MSANPGAYLNDEKELALADRYGVDPWVIRTTWPIWYCNRLLLRGKVEAQIAKANKAAMAAASNKADRK